METQDSKTYDIAISFLQQDEKLAWQIHDELSASYSVFVYSKKREEVGATDGLDTYRAIFSKKAKVVVVLYRSNWGNTPFTALEESAIKDFCLRNQYRNLVFVKLDKTPNPSWLPETHIWIDFDLYKLAGTIGVINLRAQEAGLVIKHQSALDRAKVAERRQQAAANRDIALRTNGGEAAGNLILILFNSIKIKTLEIATEVPSLGLQCEWRSNELVVRGTSRSLRVVYRQTYSNIIEDVPLECKKFQGSILLPGQSGFYFEEPRCLATQSFAIDYQDELGWHWRAIPKAEVFSSENLAEKIMKWLIDDL